MAQTWKATATFSSKWSNADKKISEELKNKKRIPFYIHLLAETVDDALEDVKVDDAVDYTINQWKKKDPIKIKDFSPDVLQGYHGISLEKAIKSRYKKEFAKNSLEPYKSASLSMDLISKYEEKFKEDSKFE